MTETQIRYFVAVSDELSFSRAAQKLYVSQPAVSKNIALLENELGFMLFDRTGKHTRITDEAKIFREYIDRSYADFYQTLDQIRQLRSDFNGHIKIGIVDTWSTSQFYDEIAVYFAKMHPNIELQVEAYGVDHMLTVLRDGGIDIGITYDFIVSNHKDIAAKPFITLDAGFLYEPTPDCPKTKLEDFRDMPFILKGEGSEPIRKLIQSLCASHGFNPRFIHSKGAGQEITDVRHGNAVLFCCEWHFWKETGMFQYFPINHRMPTKLIYIPDQEGQTKNIFLNEIEMLFAQRISKSEPV